MPAVQVLRISNDERAGAVFGEQFQQQDMRHTAVQDRGSPHTLFHRLDRGFQFWNHAARDGSVRHQLARLAHREAREHAPARIKHTFHIGQQDQPFGPNRARDGARHGVGIDVVGFAVRPDANRRHDRNQFRIR